MRWLGLNRAQLAAMIGYTNVSKGCRRLDEMCHGDIAHLGPLLAKLPDVLDLPQDVVTEAIETTKKQVKQSRPRRHYPRAWISHPDVDYFIYKHLRGIWLDKAVPVEDMHRLIQTEIAWRQRTYRSLGPVDGYVIHFSAKHVERYDLDGNPMP